MSDLRRVVVVGSGPAGAMAAHTLVSRRVPVTMLEAGVVRPSGLLVRARGRNVFRRVPPVASPPPSFVATGDPDTLWTTNLALGGMSNQWTGAVPRFSADDFHEGARLHERYRWPVTYDDLAPHYAAAERLMHVTAGAAEFPTLPAGEAAHRRKLPKDWEPVARAARQAGQGLTVLPLADGPDWLLTRRGTAFNSFSTIVRPLLPSPLFELRTGAHVLQLEWSAAQRRITGVVYHDVATGQRHRVEAAGVVVAGGPLRSTKLLFDSACPDFPDGIGNTDGLLGRYLHDHPKEWWTFTTDRAIHRLAPAGYLTRGPYEGSTPLMASSWTIGNASTRDKVLSLLPLRTDTFAVQVFGTMIPQSDQLVRPHPTELDEHGLPQLEISIHFSPEEVDNMAQARAHLMHVMGEAGYASTPHPVVPQLWPGHAVHFGGTARMHSDRQHGVLNEWNRPFDVPNLVVCDASCFTTNTEKNPTLTAMALAARAAERLAHDLRTG